jgi:predicted DNA repair protein MutK
VTGLLALLDDVATLAKLAATQVDDVAAHAAKASSKAAGVVIDDSAVTPKYVHGLPAAREIPIVAQIARGSLFNKLVLLLPAALLLSAFAPWALAPLLMLGGAYLCYEGAEKVWHTFGPHGHDEAGTEGGSGVVPLDAAHLERERVSGAIKTDFILSAEIMAIALATIESDSVVMRGIVLAVVAVGITVLVYGVVALLVKADDVGLRLSQTGQSAAVRGLGRGLVHAMPTLLGALAVVGTGAMLWVGGSIIVHGLEELGAGALAHWVHDVAVAAAALLPVSLHALHGFAEWFITASIDGVFGLAIGLTIVALLAGLSAARRPHPS